MQNCLHHLWCSTTSLCLNLHVCFYIYTYIHLHTHTYIYIPHGSTANFISIEEKAKLWSKQRRRKTFCFNTDGRCFQGNLAEGILATPYQVTLWSICIQTLFSPQFQLRENAKSVLLQQVSPIRRKKRDPVPQIHTNIATRARHLNLP